MPFTPFHMGPGLLIKALLRGGFSLMVFGWAQILIDLQPLVVLLRGDGPVHGFSHTWLGAALIAPVAALSGKPLSEFGLRVLGLSRADQPVRIAWWVAWASAFIGTFSHVLFDAIMHADMQPLAPLSGHNALLGTLDVGGLHWFCVGSGVAGAILYFGVSFSRRRVTGNDDDV